MADFTRLAGEALSQTGIVDGVDQLFDTAIAADPAPPSFVVAPVGATKVGSEFLVNTQTFNDQQSPTITGLSNGGFVVSWSDSSGTLGDASASSIKAQVFDAAGAKVGSEFLVNTQTGSDQYVPTITGLANGGFVVTWSDNSGTLGDADGGSVKAQVFNAAGAKLGSEFLVNTQTAGVQYYSTITGLANGGFVVTWSSDIGGGSVAAQVFDAAGAKLGSEFRVDTQTTSNQQFPTITGLSNGGFVVTWQDSSGTLGDASATSIKAQVFDAAGAKLGGEFLVNTQTAGDQIASTITGLTNGGFVVTWTDYSGTLGDASSASCKGQLFNAAGVKQGGEFLINTQTANSQLVPTVAELANGGFVVTWSDLSGTLGDASNYGVKAQVFDATGLKIGSEFLVNTQTQSDQYASEITGLANGGFVITWTDTDISGDGSGYSIKAQIFSVVAPNVAPTISNLQGDVVTETEGQPENPYLDVGRNAVITDPDSANFSGGTLTVAITAGFKTNDTIGIFQDGNVALDFSTGAVSVGGVVIGTATGGYISSPASPTFSVSLNDNATPALVQTLLRAIFVRDPRVESRGGTREITTTLSDGDGGSNSYTSQLVVTAINDEPSGTDKTITINEDAPRILTVADFGFLDTTTPNNFGEGDALAAVFVTTLPTGGTLYIDTDGTGGTLGTAVIAGQRVTVAQLNAGQLVYVPAANANGTGAASFTFQVQDNNSTNGTGPGSQDTDQSPNTITFNVTAVNDAPDAVDDIITGITTGALRIGYYDMSVGEGDDAQVEAIVGAGHTAVKIFDLSDAELASIDILLVQNPDNGEYPAEYLSRLAAINQAVSNGLELIIHDRFVDGAETILPGSTGFEIVRDFNDGSQIEFIDNAHPVANGPGGPLDDASLDQGGSSSHGYAVRGSLPANADFILSRTDPNEIVTFSYRYGSGNVVYSTIPIDYYIQGDTLGAGANNIQGKAEEYLANLINHVARDLHRSTATEDTVTTIATATLLANDTDPDGDALTVTEVSATSAQGATVTLNGGSIAYNPTGSTALQALQAGQSIVDTFTYTISDGNGGTDTATVSLTVNGVNDAPVADLNGADAGIDTTAAYTENAAAVMLAPAIQLSDVDNATLSGAVVTIASGFVAGDVLRVGAGTSGTTPEGIGYSYDASTGVLTLSGSASVASYQTVLARLGFKSDSDNPGTARDITVTVSDGAASSVAAHIALTVSPVNDAPVNTVPLAQAGTEATPLVFSVANGNALSVSDPDAGSAALRVKLDAQHGSITLAGTAGLTVTGNGTHTVLLIGSLVSINAALDGLSYQGDPAYIGDDTLTITTNDRGNSGSGGALIDRDKVEITLSPNGSAESVDPLIGEGLLPVTAGEFVFADFAGSAATSGAIAGLFDFEDWQPGDAGTGAPTTEHELGDPNDLGSHLLMIDWHGSSGPAFML